MLKEYKVSVFSKEKAQQAQDILDHIAKPLKGMGLLEDMISQIAGIQNTTQVHLNKRGCLIFCADHGVVEEGVTQSKSEVTAFVASAIAKNSSNINLLCQPAHIDVFAVDVGMHTEIQEENIFVQKQSRGSNNMTQGAAMTREQAIQTIEYGIFLVGEMKKRGYDILTVGEMGIGNTTPTAAMASVYLDLPVEEMTGRGAGLSDEGLKRKIEAVKQAIKVNAPDKLDPIDVLSKVGGYDIAGVTGAFLGGLVHGVPIVMDGIITLLGALTALYIDPRVKDFMIASHIGLEPSEQKIVEALQIKPIIHAELGLGEGTGAVLVLPLLDMMLNLYNGAHTFQSIGIEQYKKQGEKA